MILCAKCGKQNNPGTRFCVECGASLKTIPTHQPKTTAAPPVNTPKNNSTRNRIIVVSIILLIAAVSCYFIFFREQPAKNDDIVSPEANDSTGKAGSDDKTTQLLAESNIRQFLDEWLKSQNNKNMATYSGFYDLGFKGTKRVSGGQVYTYNYTEWITDRTKMYQQATNLTITISDIQISYSGNNVAVAEFIHQYSSDAYKDIGNKRLQLGVANGNKLVIREEEMLNTRRLDSPATPAETTEKSYVDANGKFVFQSDCFVIVTGSFTYEADAITDINRMKNEGHRNAGYLWIPSFPSLSGKAFFAPFIGPFQSYEECRANLEQLQKTGRFWYGIKVSYNPERVEIRL